MNAEISDIYVFILLLESIRLSIEVVFIYDWRCQNLNNKCHKCGVSNSNKEICTTICQEASDILKYVWWNVSFVCEFSCDPDFLIFLQIEVVRNNEIKVSGVSIKFSS